jgi:hypothetical protein
MTTGIIAILAALVPFLIWLYRSHASAKADPKIENETRYAQINHDLAAGDGVRAGDNGSADLDELERLERLRDARQGDQRGPNAGAN